MAGRRARRRPVPAGDLPDLLDRTVAGTDLGAARRPLWELPVGFLQALLAAAAVAGWAGWPASRAHRLRFPEPPPPHVGRVPLPTLLLIGGPLAGLLLALLARRLAAIGAADAGHGRRLACGSRWPRWRRTWCWPRYGRSWRRTRPSGAPWPRSAADQPADRM